MLVILLLRRWRFSGEIGGKYFIERNLSGSFLILLWLMQLIVSCLVFGGKIK
jgi:hypothetical protein